MLELDNFVLKEFNPLNKEHLDIINQLGCDAKSNKYLGNIKYALERNSMRSISNDLNKSYIVYYNSYPIGYANIMFTDACMLSIGILPKYRGQHLAALLLDELTDSELEHNSDLDEVCLKIDKANIGSIKTALLVGYKADGSYYKRGR